MASSNGPNWPSMGDQEYAAAESMVQHARSARSNSQAFDGFQLPDVQSYPHQATQPQPQLNPIANVPLTAYSQFRQPLQPASAQEPNPGFGIPFEGKLPPPHELQGHFDQQGKGSFSEVSQSGISDSPGRSHPRSQGQKDTGNIDDSEPTSPASARSFNRHHLDENGNWTHQPTRDPRGQRGVKEETEKKPAWSELKTKAGKERKRLPLACIACRRKKIRCSGEKPSCKHCMRARIPCVYKVTQRKAAPRTDYMAMLDKRLKRMEERVIKVIPKDDTTEPLQIPRAVIKRSASGQANIGKKRGADEAFGPQLDELSESKSNSAAAKGRDSGDSKINTEGTEHLPSPDIQDHLSEVFFDNLYGQSYHVLHKPTYMRRLKAGTLPPVLVLAVCAVSARFSTHPQINSEPAFLRGETWASHARNMSLRRYDEPNITTLTVYILLGLHEFGTCQGGRSWMFAGMATRMAYALQLHRELDHDPLGRKNDKKSELSFTDREIRRRTMWACFLMDRFNSSGTERPMFADEETIKVQLPIKESSFQMEIAGPTENLGGRVPNPVTDQAGTLVDAKENMGVAAYMIRVIALWGRIIKYLNMGGKEGDPHPIWDSRSGFANLQEEANSFKTSLPSHLENTHDNLKNHAAEKLGNQFLFLHIATNQVVLFLNRFAIPTAPGARDPQDMPKSFVQEAGPRAIEAAGQISVLINQAWDYHAVAPFLGYCAFLSSTIHVFAMFSNSRWAEASKDHLKTNMEYLGKMKKYWGMFHFITVNLTDIYRRYADASMEKGCPSEAPSDDNAVFQYGDWFQKYPHGLSSTDYHDPSVHVKKEPSGDPALGHKTDLQSIEDFIHKRSPPPRAKEQKKSAKKATKVASQPEDHQAQAQQSEYQTDAAQTGMLPLPVPDAQNHMDPSAFIAQHPTQLYPQPCVNSYPQQYDLLPLTTPANTAILPQLDRHLVYGAYAGHDPTGSTSASTLSALTNGQQDPSSALTQPGGQLWDNPLGLPTQEQQQMMASGNFMGDMQTSAWFMPFNLNPPEIGGESDDISGELGGFGHGGA
ncbi:hypothetical protein ACLMJK_008956 [Lecanora helva]